MNIGDEVVGISIHGNEVNGKIIKIGNMFPVAIVKNNNGDRLDVHECYVEDLKKTD